MHSIQSYIADYGIWAVLIGTVIEGEAVVLIAGFLAHQHLLHAPSVALCAFAGSVTLDQLLFMLGRRYRDAKLIKRMRATKVFGRALEILDRHPTSFILGFRFLYGFRTVGPVALGMSNTPAMRYVILNIIAAAIWAVSFTAIGYVFGEAIETALGRLHGVKPKLIAALIIGVSFGLIYHFVGRKRHPDYKEPVPVPDE